MIRTLLWCLAALLGLSVLAVISLPGADREKLMEAIGRRSLKHSSAGLGYDDGALVWRETEPYRITVEQLPSLEGRRRGSSWNTGFFQTRMSWFGVSVREAIAHCLSRPPSRVLGDESLDGWWLDVDAARTRSIMESGLGDWDPVRARILEGLCKHYGLTVTASVEDVPMTVVRAGPGWAAHLAPLVDEDDEDRDERRGRRRRPRDGQVLHENGTLSVEQLRVSSLLVVLRETLGVQQGEDMDTSALCSFQIPWHGDWEGLARGESADELRRTLARELDLHVEDVVREVEVAHVAGVAQPPLHLR